MGPAVTEPGRDSSGSGNARRALALVAVAAAVGVGAAAIVIPTATAGGKAGLHPPTLLWKSYPLVQHARGAADRNATSQTRVASGPSVTAQSHELDYMLLMTALLATFLAVGTVVFPRRPVSVRLGGSLRSRGQTRTPKPVRRREPRRERPTPPPPPPLRELPPEDLAEPPAAAENSANTDTPDEVQRALDDLLEALQPLPPGVGREERPPELELRELIVRKYAAPASARPSIDREIDAALDRIEERRAAEALARAARRTSLARCEIRLWRGFVKGHFYAAVCEADEAFAVSEAFRLRDADTPTPQAERVLSSFLAELAHAGWAVVANGSKWYEHSLELRPADFDSALEDTLYGDDAVWPMIVYRVPRDDGGADGISRS